MLYISKKLMFFLSLFLLSGIGFGQSNGKPLYPANRTDRAREQEVEKGLRDLRQLEQEAYRGARFPAANLEKPLTKEEIKKIKALLAPNPEDLAKYKDFLRQPNTGLFRLFPDFDCESKNLIRVDANCENFIAGSWSYSFRSKKYADLDFFDIRFHEGDLIADGFLSQEILVVLGDVSLESVSPTSGGMKFLYDFKPEVQNHEAEKQFIQIANIIEVDGYKYSKRVKALENTTYAMRIVAYRNENNIKFRFRDGISSDDRRYLFTNTVDKRMDLTLAFRVIRKDKDGSISILWKELKRQESPKLIFQKNEKLSDIKDK